MRKIRFREIKKVVIYYISNAEFSTDEINKLYTKQLRQCNNVEEIAYFFVEELGYPLDEAYEIILWCITSK
jgi:hypothetical protein